MSDIETKMSVPEFNYWKYVYELEPWGIPIDDRRHAQIMNSLNNIVKANGCKIKDLREKDLRVGRFAEEFEKIKKLMYTDLEKPWLDTTKSQAELAKEGQAMLKMWSQQCGVPIT